MNAADKRKATIGIASREEHQRVCLTSLEDFGSAAMTIFGGEVLTENALLLLHRYVAAMIHAAIDEHYLDAHDEKPQ